MERDVACKATCFIRNFVLQENQQITQCGIDKLLRRNKHKYDKI